MATKAKRTVLYSSKGKKLYAVRDKTGKFKDIQQYSRAHAADIKHGSTAEAKAAKKTATKETATRRPAAKKKTGVATVKRAVKRTAGKAKSVAGKALGAMRKAVRKVVRKAKSA
jgi:hypothetical protein